MPNAYGYCRISKSRDVQVYSLDAQTETINRYYKYKHPEWLQKLGVDIPLRLPLFKDVKVSGRNVNFEDRPAGGILMGRVRKGDHIIVAKADRAFRSTYDQTKTTEMFHKAGVTMHFVDMQVDTSTPVGQLFLTIVVAFAQHEQARNAERTREALEARRFVTMNPNAKAPPGWRFVFQGEGKPRKPKQDHDTRAVANRIFKLALSGLTYAEIKTIIRKEEWLFPHKRKSYRAGWSIKYIRRLCDAAAYGFPISDRDAEGNLELPIFEVEEGDEPVMPGGTIFQPNFYPAADPLRPTED